MAWERTAFSVLVAGAVLGRYAANDRFYVTSLFGGAMVALGAGILIWAGRHYDDLHGPLRAGQSPVHSTAARIVGLASVGGSLIALLVAARVIFAEWFG